MTNLKVVETTKNTEILDNVMKKLDETYLRLKNTSNSVQIHRYVKCDKDNFQNVKNAINTLLNIKLKKERGSFDLIETIQEIILVPKNDDEKFKVDILTREHVKLHTNNLDKLFSNKSSVQNMKCDVTSEKMNLINNFVTDAYSDSVGKTWILHPRFNTVVQIGCGLEHRLAIALSQSRVNGSREVPCRNQNDLINAIVPYDPYFHWTCNTEEEINNLPTKKIIKHANNALNELEEISEKLDAYIKEVSMPASEFFDLLSDETNQKLDEMVEVKKVEFLRASQVVRKTVNVDLSFNMDIELDTLGDIEDIKKVITDNIQNQIGLNVKIDFGWNRHQFIKSQSKTLKLNGVEVISEMEKVA